MAIRSSGFLNLRTLVKRWFGKNTNLKSKPRLRPDVVQLEDRWNPAYVFVDFGDRFPAGGLVDTLNNLKNLQSGSNPSVNGPDLTFLGAGTSTITIQSYNSVFGAAAAANRATIMNVVRRYYEPTGLTVVELKATPTIVDGFSFTAAKTLADVSVTLGLNEGKSQNNDVYNFVGQGSSNGTDDLFGTFGLAGIANGLDLGDKANNRDDTALTFVSPSFVLGPLFDGDTVAHESGHNLGLRHVYHTSGATIAGQNWKLLSNSEVMAYNRAKSGSSDAMTMFSRYPTILGDGNQFSNVMSVNAPNKNIFEQFINDANVGANSAMNYVSGTGANDIITISKTGANSATVSIAAFSNNTYTTAMTVPGDGTNTVFSYPISLDKPILIYAGPSADRLVISNDLGVTVNYFGMEGVDTLVITDAGGANVTYSPAGSKSTAIDTSSDFRATVTFGGTTISLLEFETTSSVTIGNAGTVTYTSPGGVDKVTATGVVGGKTTVTGTVNGTIAAIPLTVTANKIAFNLGANEAVAANDSLILNSTVANPIPAGGMSYDGGLGIDSITVTADANFTISNSLLDLGALGSVALANVESATLTGGASANTFTFNGWTGSATIDGGTGTDTIVFAQDADITLIPSKLTTSIGTTILMNSIESANLTGGAADNTFDLSGWSGSSTVNGLGGIDTLKLVRDANFTATDTLITVSDGTSYPVASVERIDLSGGAGNNSFDLNAWTGGGNLNGLAGTDDISVTRDSDFNLTGTSLTVSGGLPITIAAIENAALTGGTSDNDFIVNGWQGNAVLDGKNGSDLYRITPGTKSSVIQIGDSGPAIVEFDEVEIIGTSGDDTYTIEPNAVVSGLQRVQYLNVESVLIDGGAGNDTFITDINLGTFKGGPFTLEGGSGLNTFVISGTPALPIQQSGVMFTGGTSGKILLDPDGSITPSLTGLLSGDETVYTFNNMSKIGDVTPAARFDFSFQNSNDTITVTDGGNFASTPTVQIFDGTRGVSVARKTRVVINGGGGTDNFTVNTTAAVPGITAFDLRGGSSVDAFNVNAVNLPVNLIGGGNDDTFDIGTATGGLDAVTGAITIDGGTGSNFVTLNDAASISANTNGIIGSTGVTGLSGNGSTPIAFVAGTISSLNVFGATGFSNTIAVNATDFPLTLTTGIAADSITLAAVGAPASIQTGDGADTVTITGISTGLTVLTQDGDDTVAFNNATGTPAGSLDGFTTPFTFDAGVGIDRVAFNDASDTTGNSYSVSPTAFTRSGGVSLGYANVESAILFGGGTGKNIYSITGLTGGVNVTDGIGNGTFNIAGDTLGGINTFNGDNGFDLFNFSGNGIAAATTVNGGTGPDQSDIRGTSGDDNVIVTTNVTDGSVAGAGAGTLTYTGLESVFLNADAGNNRLTYTDGTTTSQAYQYTPATGNAGSVNGPTGTTALNFTNVNTSLTFNGGSARDTLSVFGVSSTGQATNQETTSVNGVDTINISDTNIAIVNTTLGMLRGIAVSTNAGVPTIKTLIVRTGNESSDSADIVTVTPSNRTDITIYGGNPSKTPGDKLVVVTSGPRTVTLDTDVNGKTVTRVTQISDGSTVTFAEFETAPRVELIAVGSGPGAPSLVQVYDAGSGQNKLAFSPFGDGFTGGVSVATGDVNGDQYPDIIVAAGPSGGPIIKVYDGIFGTEIATFLAYDPSFRGGVQVASGDIDGDGLDDIVIGSGVGGAPHVQVVSAADFNTRVMNFFAYDQSFRSGVQVTTGDLDGDGRVDLITGAGAGGGPHIRAFSGKTGEQLANFFAFDPNYRGGVNVTAADVLGTGKVSIIAAPASAGTTNVYAYAANGTPQAQFNASGTTGAILPFAREDGVRLGTADIDGDGVADVITARGRGTQPVLRMYKLGSASGQVAVELIREQSVFGPSFTGGVYVG